MRRFFSLCGFPLPLTCRLNNHADRHADAFLSHDTHSLFLSPLLLPLPLFSLTFSLPHILLTQSLSLLPPSTFPLSPFAYTCPSAYVPRASWSSRLSLPCPGIIRPFPASYERSSCIIKRRRGRRERRRSGGQRPEEYPRCICSSEEKQTCEDCGAVSCSRLVCLSSFFYPVYLYLHLFIHLALSSYFNKGARIHNACLAILFIIYLRIVYLNLPMLFLITVPLRNYKHLS